MKFGIWTPLPHTIREEPDITAAIAQSQRREMAPVDAAFQFALDTVLKAEAYGFGITLIAERFLGPDLESWMLSASLAAKTSTIEIMPAVHPGMVNPQIVAKMGATLDRISGGRFAVNVVNGWWKDEFNLFGNGTWLEASEGQHKRMDEFVQVVRGLWSQETFSFNGEYFKTIEGQLSPKPMRTPTPPIYAASRSEAGKDVIAKHCDVWFVSCEPDPEQFEANLAKMAAEIADMHRRAACYGRTINIGVSAHVACAETQEKANADARAHIEYGKRDRIAFIATNGFGVGLVGTPELVAERIDRLRGIGVDVLMMKFSPMLDELDRFGTDVMPLLGRTPVREIQARPALSAVQ